MTVDKKNPAAFHTDDSPLRSCRGRWLGDTRRIDLATPQMQDLANAVTLEWATMTPLGIVTATNSISGLRSSPQSACSLSPLSEFMPVRNALSKTMIRDEPFSERSSGHCAFAAPYGHPCHQAHHEDENDRHAAQCPAKGHLLCGCRLFPCAVQGDFAGLTDAAQISLEKGRSGKKGEEPSCSAFPGFNYRPLL